jgi:hypothetical protein
LPPSTRPPRSGREAELVDDRGHLGLRGRVIAGQENHPASSGLARIRRENGVKQSVERLDHRDWNQLGLAFKNFYAP